MIIGIIQMSCCIDIISCYGLIHFGGCRRHGQPEIVRKKIKELKKHANKRTNHDTKTI